MDSFWKRVSAAKLCTYDKAESSAIPAYAAAQPAMTDEESLEHVHLANSFVEGSRRMMYLPWLDRQNELGFSSHWTCEAWIGAQDQPLTPGNVLAAVFIHVSSRVPDAFAEATLVARSVNAHAGAELVDQ